MNYKYMGLGLCLIMLLTGCGKDASSSNDDNTISNLDDSSVISQSNEEEIVNQSIESQAEVQVLRTNGVEIQIPEGFQDENRYGYRLYGKETGNGKIYINYIVYNTVSDTEKQNMQNEELPDFFNYLVFSCVDECYDASSSKFEMTPDTQEEITVLNNPAKLVSGHMYANEEYPDLYYQACYAMVPLHSYDGVRFPLCWIVFGEDTEENRSELTNAFDVFVKQAVEY
ncbi:MAG: hypothetical protein HDT22_05435 [Ruminococcus sp.]|nr:hypothetical protein [Ruminococcus sp.]